MKLIPALACVLALAPLPALGNDTSAVLSTGGLDFVTNENVEMLSEVLEISKEEIRVTYEFRNKSDQDESVLVAFPMPEITPNWWSPVAFPEGPDDNPFQFETTFNGEPVEATLHQYAYAFGVDRTEYITGLGLPIVPFSQAASAATDALDDETTAEMLRLGLVVPDEFDQGNGWEKHYWPAWRWRATYTWDAVFPAGETVTVVHHYKPSVGGTVGVSFMSPAYEDYDPATEYAGKYCTDDGFLNAVRKTMKDGEPYSAPFFESWISYVLTTGANWGGSIGNFKLIVDKGDPKNLISFCGEDIKKTGPTTFEMVKTDFFPSKDLEILILERQTAE